MLLPLTKLTINKKQSRLKYPNTHARNKIKFLGSNDTCVTMYKKTKLPKYPYSRLLFFLS
jgi:hypothetical protein